MGVELIPDQEGWGWPFLMTHTDGAIPPEAMTTRPTGVSIDSRTLQRGDLFVAVQGEHHDGHQFIAQAVAAGAAGLLVAHPPAGPVGVPVLQVADTRSALARLALAWRHQVDPKVVGVTGSSGKSTIKEMVAACARRDPAWSATVHATQGNLNNHWGLPLTLLRMPASCRILVVEMGMSAPGEIAALAALAVPGIGIISNIQPAHLGGFEDLPAIARAKGELLTALPPGAVAILPGEDRFFGLLKGLAANRRVVRFGLEGSGSDGRERACWAEGIAAVAGEEGVSMSFTLRTDSLALPVVLPQTGLHLVLDALAASAAALELGVDPQAIPAALASFRSLPGRGEMWRGRGGIQVIDSSYNANPGSVRAALQAMAFHPATGRHVAVLGDMLELGKSSPALHSALAADVAASQVSLLLTAGPMMAHLHRAMAAYPEVRCLHREDPADWQGSWLRELGPGDLVLIKGSRSMRLDRLVDEVRERFGNAL